MKKKKNKKHNSKLRPAILLLLLVLLVAIVGFEQYKKMNATNLVSEEYQKLHEDILFYYNGKPIKKQHSFLNYQNQNMIALSFIVEYLPVDFEVVDNQLLIVPYRLDKDIIGEEMVGKFTFADYRLHFPLLRRNGENYLDIALLPLITGMKVITEGDIIQLYSKDFVFYYSFLEDDTVLYYDRACNYQNDTLKAGEKVFIIPEKDNMYRLIDFYGRSGYIKNQINTLIVSKDYKLPLSAAPIKEYYGKLTQTFNHFTNYEAELYYDFPEKINGLDVILPTAFSIAENGNVECRMDKSYVEKLSALSYQVVAVLDNKFDPDLTHKMLTNEQFADNVIEQLDFYLKYYQLSGINLDFENVYLEDKENLTIFVTKLATRIHSSGGIVSVDVTRPNGSAMWSRFIDRKAVAEVVDFVIFMAYDEHWASSKEAGSVASLPWVESGIEAMIELVPKEKLILGIPTYMRAYFVEPQNHSKVLFSKAIASNGLKRILNDVVVSKTFDEQARQNYYEVQNKEGEFMLIWAEDEDSLIARLDLALKYDLVGVADWRYGFEEENYWQICRYKLK